MARTDANAPTLQTSMADLLTGWPAAGAVVGRHGMACVGCAMARFETIGEAAEAYGLDAEDFILEVTRPRVRRRPARR